MSDFATLLRSCRQRIGLSQEQLSELSLVSVRTIRYLESGRTQRPRGSSVGLLADALRLQGEARAEFERRAGANGEASHRDPVPSRTTAPWVPHELPAALSDFTGREESVQRLTRLLAGGSGEAWPGPVVISGMGGVGKTSFAVHVAQRLRDRFPDGQLFANLRGSQSEPIEPGRVLARFLRALGVEPAAVPHDQDELESLFRTILTGRRVLVVLDDAGDCAQVRPLLPGSRSCAVLVTSRRSRRNLDGATPVELDVLDPDDALALLGAIAGPERVAAEPAAAAAVVRACGHLPLAIRLAGARCLTRRDWSLRTLAERLADAQRRLDVLELGERGVRASFAVSYAALRGEPEGDAPDAGRAFALLGQVDGADIDLRAAAAVLDLPVERAEAMLELLVDSRLLEAPQPRRYRFHDLMRLFARETAEAELTARQREAALDRAVRYYLGAIEEADRLVRPGRLVPYQSPYHGPVELPALDHTAAIQWLRDEHLTIVGVALQACDVPAVAIWHTAGLVAHVSGFLEVRGLWQEWERVARACMLAGIRARDPSSIALAGHELALLALRRGRLDEAGDRLRRCLDTYRSVGDPVGVVRALNNLGGIAFRRERLGAALELFQEALSLCRARGIRRGECGMWANLGQAYQAMGVPDRALGCYENALGMQRELRDPAGEAITLVMLGAVWRDLGGLRTSLASLHAALRIHRAGENRYWEPRVLVELSATHRAAGHLLLARRCAEAALELCAGLQDPIGHAAAAEALAALG